MPLTTNLFHYAVYIGQIKNKLEVLTTLFDTAGIKSRPDRHARLAAGIVHGYFYSGCYEGAVPRQQLIEGYQADQDLLGMLTGTTYVHMRPDRQPKGRNILVDRQANIIAALHDLAATPALPVMTVKQNTDLLETDTVGAVSLGTLTAFAVRLIVDAQLPSGRSRVHLESAADVSGYVASALLVPMPEA